MTTPHWTLEELKSLGDSRDSLKVVDGLLFFMSGGVGKPSNNERSLFAATVVFAYGVWESYVEQAAIELAEALSTEIEPSKVPEFVHTRLEKKAGSTWALAVSPGWRALWVTEIVKAALGDDSSFGLNTASQGQVTALFKMVGIDDPFGKLPKALIPDHLKGHANTPLEALDQLVRLRGEIVHTAQIPRDLKKPHARQWRDFVQELIERVDLNCRTNARALLGL